MLVVPGNLGPMEACPACAIISAGHRDGPAPHHLRTCDRWTLSPCCEFSRGAPATLKGVKEEAAIALLREWWLEKRKTHPAKWKLEVLDNEIAVRESILKKV